MHIDYELELGCESPGFDNHFLTLRKRQQKYGLIWDEVVDHALFIILILILLKIEVFLVFSISQAIHKLTDYLSFQVRNIARELVDAFDLPDHVTRAPIAMQSEAYTQYTQHVGF